MTIWFRTSNTKFNQMTRKGGNAEIPNRNNNINENENNNNKYEISYYNADNSKDQEKILK